MLKIFSNCLKMGVRLLFLMRNNGYMLPLMGCGLLPNNFSIVKLGVIRWYWGVGSFKSYGGVGYSAIMSFQPHAWINVGLREWISCLRSSCYKTILVHVFCNSCIHLSPFSAPPCGPSRRNLFLEQWLHAFWNYHLS